VILSKQFHFFRNCLPSSAALIHVLLIVATLACQRQGFAQMPGAMSSGPARSASSGSSAAAGAGTMGVTDEPIFPGEEVSISVPNAPDFSTIARVSMSGDVPVPYLGIVHVAGLNSASAAALVEKMLIDSNLVVHPHVLVTVDAASTGITVLGEVRTPGVYPPTGKHMLSDVLAMAGGVTTNAGRIIEISSDSAPDQKTLIPWDPTLHNTAVYDRVMQAGSRIIVKPCGVAYVGGFVSRPGAYPVCGSQVTTASQLIALAAGATITARRDHTILIRTQPDGSRVVQRIDMAKILNAKAADPVVREDDIIYVPLSGVKYALTNMLGYVASFGVTSMNVYANR
jgi:polysaccharide export outer membrane protein